MNLKALMERAKQENFEAIEIFEQKQTSIGIAIFNGVVDKNEISDLATLSIRGIYDGKIAYLDLENQNEDIDFVIKSLKDNAASLTTDEKFFIFEGSPKYPILPTIEHDFEKHSHFDKIEILKQLEQKMKAKDERIIFVPYCNYSEEKTTTRIVNSKGLDIQKENGYCVVVVQVVARENDDTQSGYDVIVKKRIDEINIDEISEEVVSKTVAMLNAKPIPSNTYPIIMENNVMTDILGAFQRIFSGEAAIKKITPLIDKVDKVIMSEKITIVDDPLCVDAITKEPFDDEGVACFSKNVVDKGVFKLFLHNLKTAAYFNTTSTGNGFRTGGSIGVAPINLYIQPGEKTKKELIENLENGFFVTSVEGLHAGVNPISGDFSLKASGFLIEAGALARPVTLVVLSGNFFKMMKEVEHIANDLKFTYKGISSPSIQFKGLAVSGE